ncbi:spackle periplasmic [Edwardsiella phage PEi20]|uniref:Uncharacterized protein n=2 Tax=Kanagawavirus pei20 TaxID=2844109 RepID=A0A0B6VTT2_9CAUD|nr:spackle periplasmic [Edwardsiella phage PEi20]BAQ22685.1 conserved hypothetical protein [Edwardsiella phage PEi20]BAQ22986.1 conserved hypothetical protein [Edwardsiella phage PEi26]
MKLKSLIIAIGMFASTCAFANSMAIANMMAAAQQQERQEQEDSLMEKGYNSPDCIYSAEVDEPELRAFAKGIFRGKIDKNRAMTFEDYSFKDTLIAVQMVVCEGKTPQEAVNFVDPD